MADGIMPCALGGGGAAVGLGLSWYLLRHHLRSRPRRCPACRIDMVRLGEAADGAHVTGRRKKHRPEEIVAKLRDADAMLSVGKDMAAVNTSAGSLDASATLAAFASLAADAQTSTPKKKSVFATYR